MTTLKTPKFPDFDDTKPLIVVRSFKCVGKDLQPGALFDWQRWRFPRRRITQFWDLRNIVNPTDEILDYLEATGADKALIDKARKAMATGIIEPEEDEPKDGTPLEGKDASNPGNPALSVHDSQRDSGAGNGGDAVIFPGNDESIVASDILPTGKDGKPKTSDTKGENAKNAGDQK